MTSRICMFLCSYFCIVECADGCLSAGKGLTLVGSVIEGTFASNKENAEVARVTVKEFMKKEKAKWE